MAADAFGEPYPTDVTAAKANRDGPRFVCGGCGHTNHAGITAAENIAVLGHDCENAWGQAGKPLMVRPGPRLRRRKAGNTPVPEPALVAWHSHQNLGQVAPGAQAQEDRNCPQTLTELCVKQARVARLRPAPPRWPPGSAHTMGHTSLSSCQVTALGCMSRPTVGPSGPRAPKYRPLPKQCQPGSVGEEALALWRRPRLAAPRPAC